MNNVPSAGVLQSLAGRWTCRFYQRFGPAEQPLLTLLLVVMDDMVRFR